MSAKSLNGGIIEKIHHLYYEENLTQRQIAEILGFSSHASINKIFKVNGWKARPAKQIRQEANPEEVRRLYFDEGLSQRQVAEKLGLHSPCPVQRIFKERGWKTRGRWGDGPVYGRPLFDTEKERELGKERRVKQQQQNLKELREQLFGKECKVCEVSIQNKPHAIHRIDFKEHEQNKLWRIKYLKSLNPDEWVALCAACHRGVHWLRNQFGIRWDDIKKYLNGISHTKARTMIPFTLSSNEVISKKYQKITVTADTKIKDLREILFGNKCYFCGADNTKRRLPIHRKDGRPHRSSLLWSKGNLKVLDPEEWVALCQKCHRYVPVSYTHLTLPTTPYV